jgi:hypothetical protein
MDQSARRLATETKHATKTTEFYAYVAAVIGVLIASAMIGDDDAGRGAGFGDYLTAHGAWRLIAFLTVGYMVARGLAKAGSRERTGRRLEGRTRRRRPLSLNASTRDAPSRSDHRPGRGGVSPC